MRMKKQVGGDKIPEEAKKKKKKSQVRSNLRNWSTEPFLVRTPTLSKNTYSTLIYAREWEERVV